MSVPLEQRVLDLESRLEKNEQRLKIAIKAIDALLGKEAEVEQKPYEPQRPPFNVIDELKSRGIKYTPEDITRLMPVLKPYTADQIGFILTKVARQTQKQKINNLTGYIKRALDIEYPKIDLREKYE